MHPYLLIPLAASIFAAMVGSSVLTRDSSHRGHRLLAVIFACAVYWSALEVIWNSLDDAFWVHWLIRISSIGWMPLGALCLHLVLELFGDGSSWLRNRAVPGLYTLAFLSSAIYMATPWGIEGVHATSWGWSFTPGPLFFLLYAPTATVVALALGVLWRRVYPPDASRSERRQGYMALVAIAFPLALASVTDAILPMCGIHVPRLGSASLAIVAGAIAWSAHRYGYSLLAPGSFAPEILATLRDGVVLVRQDGIIRTVNASFARLCESAEDELMGKSIADFVPDYPAIANQEIDEHECQLAQGPDQAIAVSLSSRSIRDRLGDPVGQVLSIRDLREVVDLRNRLIMSGRLAAVGELAAGIAHEINNPIAFVQSNLNQLTMHWGNSEKTMPAEAFQEGCELLDECQEGVARVAAIVKNVRGFASGAAGEPETVDLNNLLKNSLRMAEPQLRYRARIECHFGNLPLMLSQPQELKQVFLNVILNASHAISEGGTIRISTEFVDPDIVVSIEDDGCGMTPEVLERIFDPFFSTKKVGEGTGLGLSLSYQMVKALGGDIRVVSEPQRGTCFYISLPMRLS